MKGLASNLSRRDWGLARGLAVACYERGSLVSENHVKPVTITRTNIIEPRALSALWSLKVTLNMTLFAPEATLGRPVMNHDLRDQRDCFNGSFSSSGCDILAQMEDSVRVIGTICC